MKLKKSEKLWLIAVIGFYFLYNIPHFPAYGDTHGTLIHAVLTLIPLWVFVYVGMFKVFSEYPL